MTRKTHLLNTKNTGPVCQGGNFGAALRGEHMTVNYAGFTKAQAEGYACGKCAGSKLFAFLAKQAAKEAPKAEETDLSAWEPEHPDAWKLADDKLIRRK